ncbi:MAG: hypothetical protein JO218_10440 [Burkholderiales bacterium]|nr:hypothetical protein [Burkholderiales bacterium]
MFMLIQLIIIIAVFAGVWKVFEKAGRKGWEGIIPIYNMYVLLLIIGKPVWWIILMFIPLVNLVIFIIVNIELAKRFGKDALYGLGLTFLGFIFFPILGFSDAQFQGGAGGAS